MQREQNVPSMQRMQRNRRLKKTQFVTRKQTMQ